MKTLFEKGKKKITKKQIKKSLDKIYARQKLCEKISKRKNESFCE